MSIFGSISGFISAISRTGSDAHDPESRSGSPPSPSESSSAQSITEDAAAAAVDGCRRISGAVAMDTPEVDLSNLSEEERAQIAAVIARAKSLQNFSDLDDQRDRNQSGDKRTMHMSRGASVESTTNISGNENSTGCCATCRLTVSSSSSVSCSGCCQLKCLTCCRRSQSGGCSSSSVAQQQTSASKERTWKCFECSAKNQSSVRPEMLLETGSGALDDASIVESRPEADAYEKLRDTSAGNEAATPTTDERVRTEDSSDLHIFFPSSLQLNIGVEAGQSTTVVEAESPTQRTPDRPRNLILSQSSSLSSSAESLADTGSSWSSSDGPVIGRRAVDPKSTSEPQLTRVAPGERPDGDASRTETRCRSRSFDGSDRKRPKILKDRGCSGYQDFDRNQSPSRRSPKSPPRSPSWLRLRESPTRTNCIRTRSPTSEKYPSKLLDEAHHTGLPCSDEYREYLGERRNPSIGPDCPEVSGGADDEHGQAKRDFYASDDRGAAAIDLASFAATVASGTAHLTSMSFSPPTPQPQPTASEVGASKADTGKQENLFPDRSNPLNLAPDAEHLIDEVQEVVIQSLFTLSDNRWSPKAELSTFPDLSPPSETIDLDLDPVNLHRSRKPPHIEDIASCSYGGWAIAETSPTFGTFKRCPSYNNILSLPELDLNDPGSARSSSQGSSQVRADRITQSISVDVPFSLPNLPEEQEEHLSKFADPTTERTCQRDSEPKMTSQHETNTADVTGRDFDFAATGSLLPTGMCSMFGDSLTADNDDQIFLSDEELREIDLDEELPPKHLLVRKPRKSSLPMDTNQSSASVTRQPLQDMIVSDDDDDDDNEDDREFKTPSHVDDDDNERVNKISKEVVEKEMVESSPRSGARRRLPPVPSDVVARNVESSEEQNSTTSKSTESETSSVLKPRPDLGENDQGTGPPSKSNFSIHARSTTSAKQERLGFGSCQRSIDEKVTISDDGSVIIKNTAYKDDDPRAESIDRGRIRSGNESEMNDRSVSTIEVQPQSVNKRPELAKNSVEIDPETMKTTSKVSSVIGKQTLDERGVKVRPKVPPKPKRTEPSAVATVSLKYGLEIPITVHALQQRVKDEVKILTATRRLRLDEAEEIRILEAEFAERSKERRLRQEHRTAVKGRCDGGVQSDDEYQRGVGRGGAVELARSRRREDDLESNRSSRSSTLSLPFSTKQFKRPSSDPMAAKFSPIDEDFGSEAIFLASKQSQEGHDTYYVRQGPHPEVVTRSMSVADHPFAYRTIQFPVSLTEVQDDSESRGKEERLQFLQTEIEKRRRRLNSMGAQRPGDSQATGGGGGGGPISDEGTLTIFQSDPVHKESRDHRVLVQSTPPHPGLSSGLIKPIDYQINPEKYYVRTRQQSSGTRTSVLTASDEETVVYSSFEYVTHKAEMTQKAGVTSLGANSEFLFAPEVVPGYVQPTYLATEKEHIRYSESEDSLLFCPGNYGSSRDSGVSSSMTGPDLYAFRSDQEHSPAQGDGGSLCCHLSTMQDLHPTRRGQTTPAMPLLGDVTMRSRSLLRDIGSRPLSEDADKYFQASDSSSKICRDESDYSVTDSVEDYILEGGLTIRMNSDRKPRRSMSTPRKYPFPTKRILLTSDPKDKLSRGFGVNIIGGQYLPWGGDQLCAYVTYIQPGSVADQLHGELQEGDQVLELNGEILTGKSTEEVALLKASSGCEIEMVVRHGMNLRTFRSITMSTINTGSNRSSYDNMPTASSFEGYESIDGLDKEPPGQAVSGLGVQPPLVAKERTEYLHGDVAVHHTSTAATRKSGPREHEFKMQTDDNEKYLGEIQVQMSFDDYDGTLNVHIIQAKHLQPKYKTGYSDPFVKVYLLPYRSSESKRKTKCVARTLNPEWHRTLVFLNIPRLDLVSKTIDISVWDHDRFMPNQFLGEILLDLADETLLDNRPHWYRLTDDCDHSRFGRRPRTGNGTLSSSDSAQSSTSSHSRRPDRAGQQVVGGVGVGTGGPRGGAQQEPPSSRHRYMLGSSGTGVSAAGGIARAMSDSEESTTRPSRHYENLMCRELSVQSAGSHVFKSEQLLSECGSDVIEQRSADAGQSRTDFVDKGHGGLVIDRGQGPAFDIEECPAYEIDTDLGLISRTHRNANNLEEHGKMAASLHCFLSAIFCCLRSSPAAASNGSL